MALIKCLKCSEQYSDSLSTCPHCDYSPTIFRCPECGFLYGTACDSCPTCGYVFTTNIVPTIEEVQMLYQSIGDSLKSAKTLRELRKLGIQLYALSSLYSVKDEIDYCQKMIADLEEEERKKAVLSNAISRLDDNLKAGEIDSILRDLKSIGDYKNCSQIKDRYQTLASEELYKKAVSEGKKTDSEEHLQNAIKYLEQLGNYKDSKRLLKKTQERLNYLTRSKKKKKRRIVFVVIFILLVAGGILCYLEWYIPYSHYKAGLVHFNNEEYQEAVNELSQAGDFMDTTSYLKLSNDGIHYKKGISYLEIGSFEEAIKEFELAEQFSDSATKILETHYREGITALEGKEFDRAIQQFKLANTFSDARSKVLESYYAQGCNFFDNGRFDSAANSFAQCKEYENSSEKIYDCGVALLSLSRYSDAANVFEMASYKDSDKYYQYCMGMQELNKGNYDKAREYFNRDGNIDDTSERVKECYYKEAKKLFGSKEYDKAKTSFVRAGDYADAERFVNICPLMKAEGLYKSGDLKAAIDAFSKLPTDLEYNNISVSDRLNTLNRYKTFVDMCGEWVARGDMPVKVTETSKSTGAYHYWTGTYTNPSDKLVMRCFINNDGTVTMKGSASFQKFDNYSVTSEYIDRSKKTVDINITQSNPPYNTLIADYVSLTYSYGTYTLSYYMVDTTENVYFTYTYESTWTFNTCIKDY